MNEPSLRHIARAPSASSPSPRVSSSVVLSSTSRFNGPRRLGWLTVAASLGFTVLPGCAAPLEDAKSSSQELSSVELTLDPTHSYEDRLKMMTLLAERHPYPSKGDATLWADQRDGILLQTEWQQDTGRHVRPDTRVGGWWANVNYTLNAWQMIILRHKRHEFENVEIITFSEPRFLPPADIEEKLLDYYDTLDELRVKVDAGLPFDQQVDASTLLLRKLWAFHGAAIDFALARNNDVFRQLPDGERTFADSWGFGIVPILTAANFPTTGGPVTQFGDLVLPENLVERRDYNLFLPSTMPFQTRVSIVAMKLVTEFERLTNHKLARLLEKLARTNDGAVKAAQLVRYALTTLDPVGILLDALQPFDN